MATKKNETKNTVAQQIQENQLTQIEEQNQNAENQSAENVQSEQAQNQNEQAQTEDTQNAPVQHGENTQNQQEPQKENEMQKKELIAFHKLAAKYRLPSWQSAAILKLLDKEDDAHLTENEFTAALEKLYNRKMGA